MYVPRNENLEGGFLVFGVGMVAGILIDTSSDFLALDDFLATFFELEEKNKGDFVERERFKVVLYLCRSTASCQA